MGLDKAKRRQRKHDKARHGMQVTNRGIFVLEKMKKKRADKIRTEERKKRREGKE